MNCDSVAFVMAPSTNLVEPKRRQPLSLTVTGFPARTVKPIQHRKVSWFKDPAGGTTRRGHATLEHRARTAHTLPMNDTPHNRRPADVDPPMPSEAELLVALAESEAE